MTELCDLTAVELRKLIGAKEISPVELLASCRRRIDAVNPVVNAITATCWPRAEHEAREAEKKVLSGESLGLLHGLPIGIKDLDETEGVTTTFGSLIYKSYIPDHDDAYVARVRKAGAIVVGKTNVPQLGLGGHSTNPVYGPTRNPFDPRLIAGGSSGGAAAAAATSMLPLCSASDSGGSTRNPAAFCGVVGLRQTAGIVPQPKRPMTWSHFPIKGPIGRTVEDTSLLLAAMAGYDTRDPFSRPLEAEGLAIPPHIDLSGLRVAFSEDLGFALVDQRIRSTFRERRSFFESVFASIADAHPDHPHGNDIYEILRSVTAVATLGKHMADHGDLLGENNVMMFDKGKALTGETIAWALSEQSKVFHRFQDFFDQFDLLITPTVGAPPHGCDDLYQREVDGKPVRTFMHTLALTYGVTVTGHPAITIPCGFEPGGTPFHLQLVAGKDKDKFLLGAARALEHHLSMKPETARPIPDIEALSAETRSAVAI